MKQPVRNPYSDYQPSAAQTSCWVCYRLLWTMDECKAHLCHTHQQTHVAVDSIIVDPKEAEEELP